MIKILSFYFKLFGTLALISFVAVIALIYYYSRDLPDYSQLANYHPPSVTRIYARDGKLIEEYALERRVFVPIKNIPNSLINAFIAAEDKNFFNHPGIDISGILRAFILNIPNLIHHRKMEGGSTITQQVVKNFLLTSEVSLKRKVKEAVLSYRISKAFTKEQILELYLNQTFFGRGAYGVAIAAQNYFNKSIEELNLAECAFIAGLPKAPSNFNPEKNYARVKERRDYVITRMVEDGYVTKEVAKEAKNLPITLQKRDRNETVTAGYYAEEVREEVIKMLGSREEFYTAGLTIITSLETNMQKYAEDALLKGIREYDRKYGFRGAIANVTIENWQDYLNNLVKPAGLLEYEIAIVLNVTDKQAEIGLKDGSKSKIPLSEMKWAKTNPTSVKNILKQGDVIAVELTKTAYALRQIPAVNGAIIVMNPTTGQVLASVGGYDFSVSKFDRVTQALRQPGSVSKSFVYLAALESGIQPNQIFTDGPVEISQGPGMPTWRPKNYKGDFLGEITMRSGLEKSRNLVTVRVAGSVGLNKVAETIKRFGINDSPPKFYSMVLGAIETTLVRMTNAYAIFANSGKQVTPHFVELIKDRNGKIIYRRDNRGCPSCLVTDLNDEVTLPNLLPINSMPVTDEASNYQIVSLLTGAVDRGTAYGAKKLGKIMAGKTGTSNDSKDTWFIGFTPKIVVGTYMGYDTPKSMGRSATGSNVALPVFIDFMEHAYKDVPSLAFKVPDSIKLLAVDKATGKITPNGNIVEAFKVNNINIIDADDVNNIFNYTPTEQDNSQEIY